MTVKKSKHTKKFFTAAQANAALPLVQAIVRDIADLAHELGERQERSQRFSQSDRGALGDPYREEWQQVQSELDRKQEQILEFVKELAELGVAMKDPHTGLVDFPAWMDGHEVCLCWRLGEPQVAFWHEIETGFAGRKKLLIDTQAN